MIRLIQNRFLHICIASLMLFATHIYLNLFIKIWKIKPQKKFFLKFFTEMTLPSWRLSVSIQDSWFRLHSRISPFCWQSSKLVAQQVWHFKGSSKISKGSLKLSAKIALMKTWPTFIFLTKSGINYIPSEKSIFRIYFKKAFL